MTWLFSLKITVETSLIANKKGFDSQMAKDLWFLSLTVEIRLEG